MANYKNDADAEAQFQEWLSGQSGYVGKSKKAQWWNDYAQSQQNNAALNDLIQNDDTKFSVTGSPNAVSGRIEGLERAKILTGQNPYEIGADYQEAYGNIKKRSTMNDTGSELLRANKAGAVADAKADLQKAGVKGGAQVGAVSQVERAKSYDVNHQLMENQRKAEQDYLNAAKSNANFTQASEMNYGAMGEGRDVKAPPSNSGGFGEAFGTVICTELYRQGYYTETVYDRDQIYGRWLLQNKPHVYFGYRLLADPVVKLMKKSKLFTKLVAVFAVPWAKDIAGESHLFGRIIHYVGFPLCSIVGKFFGGTYVLNQEKV